jgi:F-type H+-transporting ATPase subunit a
MPTQLLFTRVLNAHLAAPIDAILSRLHIQPAVPSAPISDTLMMEVLITLGLILYFVAIRLTLDVERPSLVQHFAELTHGAIGDQAESIIGHGSERFLSFLTVIALFILPCNLVGLIPGLDSPTANVVVPLGLAILTFCYYQYHGIRKNGWKYYKQFIGPIWWLSPLLLPIEIISHFARLLSLTVRLYANIFAGALITLVFFSLMPIGLPLVFMGMHLMVAILQAFVFMLLAMIYLSLALSEEH